MKFYSQAGQDRFVNEVLIKPERMLEGTFLDIGCCHPTEISNTYGLEQRGWLGLLCDIDPGACKLCREQRVSPVIEGNAVAVNWKEMLVESKWNTNERDGFKRKIPFRMDTYTGPLLIDYLSLDIDSGTDDVLAALPHDDVVFRVITLEHDAYRFGDRARRRMRDLLKQHGYALVCADVCSEDGSPYEDWFVAPDFVPLKQWERFVCAGKRWPEILALA